MLPDNHVIQKGLPSWYQIETVKIESHIFNEEVEQKVIFDLVIFEKIRVLRFAHIWYSTAYS